MSAERARAAAGAPFALRAVLAVAIAWALSVALESLAWPFGRDQGIFAWVGDVILRGGLPYLDAWEVKGPATHYSYALAQLVFGRVPWAVRALDLILLGGAMAAAASLTRSLGGAAAACWSAALGLAFLHWQGGAWNTAQPDAWAAWWVLSGVAVLVRSGGARSACVFAGACCAGAALYKPPFALLAGVPLVWLALNRREALTTVGLRTQPGQLAQLGLFAAGGLGIAGLVLAGFALSGGLAALVDVQLGFNLVVHQGQHARGLLGQLGAFGAWLGDLRILALVALSLWGLRARAADAHPMNAGERTPRRAAILGSWCAIAVLLIVLQDKHYDYHYALLEVPLAVAAGHGAGALLAVYKGADRVVRAALVIGALGVVALEAPLPDLDAYRAVRGGAARTAYEAKASNPAGGFSYLGTREAAESLRDMTQPGDAIFVWGFDPALYFLSGRPAASRFGFAYPLIVSEGSAYQDRYRDELLRELAAEPPAAFVVAHDDANNLLAKPSAAYLAEFSALDAWLREHYAPAARLTRYAIWRKRPD